MDEMQALQLEAENLRQTIQETSDVPPIKLPKLTAREILEGHLSLVYCLQWAGDSRKLISASRCGRLITWDTYKKEKLHLINMKYNWVMTCASSPSFRLAASGGLDNACTIYTLGPAMEEVKPSTILKGHSDYLSCCKFIDEKYIITASGDSRCILWDLEKEAQITDFVGHNSGITSVALSPDKWTFVTGCCDSTAKLWDVRDPKSQQTFVGHRLDVNTVSFFPSGQAFVTGSDDSSCLLFDIRADQQLAHYKCERATGGITSAFFSKSGRILLTTYDDYYCPAWDALKVTCMGEWASRENRISCAELSPDGNEIATGSWDSALKIWDSGALKRAMMK